MSAASPKDVADLTLKIYDTVADEKAWDAVLDHFVDRVGAQGCILFEWRDTPDGRRLAAPFFSGFYNAPELEIYLAKCAHLEARDQEALRANTGDDDEVDLVDDTVLARSKTELENQEHMKTLRLFNIFHRAAGVMNKDNRWLSLFSVQLNKSRGPLTDAERAYMAALLPHFAKALDLGLPMRQLSRRSESVLAAIDRLNVGMCLLDERGAVVVANEEFRRQEEAYRAFRITPDGKLRLADDQGQNQLASLMSTVRNHGKFGARPRKEAIATDGFLCIEVSPLTRAEEIGSSAFSGFILTSTDTSRPVACDVAPMRDAFGLTEAELSLVEAIGEGLTNPQIADRRGRSTATINAQVKSILSKSRCATRAQFVRMMMRFGANFLAERR